MSQNTEQCRAVLRLWPIKSLSGSDLDAILCGSQPVNVETWSRSSLPFYTEILRDGLSRSGRHSGSDTSISRLQAFVWRIATTFHIGSVRPPRAPKLRRQMRSLDVFRSSARFRNGGSASYRPRTFDHLWPPCLFPAPITPDSVRISSQDCRTLSSLASPPHQYTAV